jgi:hypothetical protein
MKLASVLVVSVSLVSFASGQTAHKPIHCPTLDTSGDTPMQTVALPPATKCSTSSKDSFLLPDPTCTPGAVNPSLTLDVLKNKSFTTKCVRDMATKPAEKAKTYRWYHIPKPRITTALFKCANSTISFLWNWEARTLWTIFGRNVGHRE